MTWGMHRRRDRASIQWLSNENLRRRRRPVSIVVEDDRLLAVGSGWRWWRHFLHPGQAQLRVGPKRFVVWARIDPAAPLAKLRLGRRRVTLILDPPQVSPLDVPGASTTAPETELDLREGVAEAQRSVEAGQRRASR